MGDAEKVNYDELEVRCEAQGFLDSISCDYPDTYRLKGKLFTGTVCEYAKKYKLDLHYDYYEEFEVVDGLENGKFFSLYLNGAKRTEGVHKNGCEFDIKEWSADGILLHELDGAGLTEKFYYPTGELQISGSIKWISGDASAAGALDWSDWVEHQYFDRNGYPITQEQYEKVEKKPRQHASFYKFKKKIGVVEIFFPESFETIKDKLGVFSVEDNRTAAIDNRQAPYMIQYFSADRTRKLCKTNEKPADETVDFNLVFFVRKLKVKNTLNTPFPHPFFSRIRVDKLQSLPREYKKILEFKPFN
ncbi:MAG: hypothetical protein FWD58_05050 [Firmicutes bacterium]|nr:hypothetical protein [Bacillota bacterium]